MVARQEDFNADINLLMLSEVGNLHHIQDYRSCDLLNPWLGDYIGLLPSHLHQVSMQHENCILISISKVEVTDLQSWDQSQLGSNCAYPPREVRNDQRVFKFMWYTFTVNRAIQRRGVVRQDRRDLLHVSQIIAVLPSFLSSTARSSPSR
jgi:hypothetical protein